MLINPYENVNWSTFQRIQTNTHNHLYQQAHIDNAFANGMRFIGCHPHYGKPLFPVSDLGLTIPDGAIEYALAEHYGNFDTPHPIHYCAIGSTLITDDEAPHGGFQGTAHEFIDAARATLQVEDGGGVIWNHPGAVFPTPANINLNWMMDLYDYAPDIFLGVEFYNNSQGKTYPNKEPFTPGWWDALLRSGRHVWGFANPDYEARRLDPYPDWEGKMFLMVPSFTRENCLKAIRNGEFFCCIKNTGLYFTSITNIDNTISVKVNENSNIKFITATREVVVEDVDTASLLVNTNDIYVRVEATSGEGKIFSQALMHDGIDPTPPQPPQHINVLVKRLSILV